MKCNKNEKFDFCLQCEDNANDAFGKIREQKTKNQFSLKNFQAPLKLVSNT